MHWRRITSVILILAFGATLSCNKLQELSQDPELEPLDQGIKSTAAIAYCVSLATRAFNNEPLPSYVTFSKKTTAGYSSSGLLYISATGDNPVPFNKEVGDIIVAGLWDGSGGVISIVFADIKILGESKFYGIHTIPIIKNTQGEIVTLFAQQDIVIGEGSDTLLQLSLSKVKFNTELDRLNSERPSDAFVAVTQNVWHITMDKSTSPSVFSDRYTVTGGGQIIAANSNSGGVLYHAMINTTFDFALCPINPLAGTAFIQNLQAGSSLDLGNILLEFHSSCNGKAEVKVATGKYITSNGQNINLNWNR
jgi:hypothetical protein